MAAWERLRRWAPAIPLVVAAALRLWRLDAESLWIDEAASLRYIEEHDLAGLLFEVPLAEPHPPLYYALLDGWTSLAGTSLSALRLPSVAFGVATVGLVFALGSRLVDRRVGLAAASLAALSGFAVSYAQQARMYTLLAFATVASFWAFVAFLQEGGRRRGVAVVVAGVLVGYAHAFGLLVLAWQAAYVLVRRPWRDGDGPAVRAWAACGAAVAVGLAPWMAMLATGLSSGETAQRIAWIEEPSGAALLATPAWFLGLAGIVDVVGLALVGSLATGLLFVGLDPRRGGGDARRPSVELLVGGWLAVGVLVPFVASLTVTPLFVPRYTIVAAPAFFLGLAVGLSRLPRGWLAGGLACLVLAASAYGSIAYLLEDRREPWDKAAAFVAEGAQADEVVLVGDHRPGWVETERAFTYHFEGSAPVVGIADTVDEDELGNRVAGRSGAWLVLSRVNDTARSRLVDAVQDAGFVPVEERRWPAISVHRFTAGPSG